MDTPASRNSLHGHDRFVAPVTSESRTFCLHHVPTSPLQCLDAIELNLLGFARSRRRWGYYIDVAFDHVHPSTYRNTDVLNHGTV